MVRTDDADFSLLDRWAAGDRAAGNVLLTRYFDSLYRLFGRKVSDEGEVDDLIQRVLLACVESRLRFRRTSSFRTYLFTVARNTLFAHYRRRSKESARQQPIGSMSLIDLGTSPRSAMVQCESKRTLLEALHRLPLDLQLAIELHYWEGLTTAELATVLDTPRGTVKSRLRRAREALRREMNSEARTATPPMTSPGNFERWAAGLRGEASSTSA